MKRIKVFTSEAEAILDEVATLRRDNARLRGLLRSWLSECDHLDVSGGAYSRARVVTANDLLAALKDAPPKKMAR